MYFAVYLYLLEACSVYSKLGEILLATVTCSGGYSNSGPRGKNFQKLMFSRKRFDLVFHFSLQKSW